MYYFLIINELLAIERPLVVFYTLEVAKWVFHIISCVLLCEINAIYLPMWFIFLCWESILRICKVKVFVQVCLIWMDIATKSTRNQKPFYGPHIFPRCVPTRWRNSLFIYLKIIFLFRKWLGVVTYFNFIF